MELFVDIEFEIRLNIYKEELLCRLTDVQHQLNTVVPIALLCVLHLIRAAPDNITTPKKRISYRKALHHFYVYHDTLEIFLKMLRKQRSCTTFI